MLIINLERVFSSMGIENPAIWLQTRGINKTTSYRLVYGDIKKMDMELLERLCRLFHSDVHSLLEWIPDGPDDNEDCLCMLKKDPLPDMREIRKNIPLDKQKEFMDKVSAIGKEFKQQKSK